LPERCGFVVDREAQRSLLFQSFPSFSHHESILAWTTLGLYYGVEGNDIRAEHSFSEAEKIGNSVCESTKDEEKAPARANETSASSK